MSAFIDVICRWLSRAMAACLALMVVLVFGNVCLRYLFNSGITLSEELSRWLFVWMIFLGAIVALRDRAHLGTDMLVGRLRPRGKWVCALLTRLCMLCVCVLLFQGAYAQALINRDATSAVMQASMAWLYLPELLFSVMGALIIAHELWQLLRGGTAVSEAMGIAESEEAPHPTPGQTSGARP